MAGELSGVQPGPTIQIVIAFQPATGAFQVAWPNVDSLTKLGLLEGAKASLMAEIVTQINAAKSGLVLPAPGTRVHGA